MLRYKLFSTFPFEADTFLPVVSRSLHSTPTYEGIKKKLRKSKCGCKPPPKSVAVILCGCGSLDGTDISEAMSATFHLCQKNVIPKFYAPKVEICGVVNHLTKKIDDKSPSRCALREAARIARSNIKPLCECEACQHQGIVIPGGFGLARTLSDFAAKGAGCTVNPEFESLVVDFHCDDKPIGSICIASAIVAKILKGVKITLGKNCPKEDWPYAEAIDVVKEMGAKHEPKDVCSVAYCKKFNVYSTPAWMYNRASYTQIHEGIGKLVAMMVKSMC